MNLGWRCHSSIHSDSRKYVTVQAVEQQSCGGKETILKLRCWRWPPSCWAGREGGKERKTVDLALSEKELYL